ncbi:hypothetical protein [Nocardioides campestrisoli]|uniref:hypothetical protein n=1 Tax=Nocardioides campestrisoli TaxID=2736757 RepID=UPI0015E633B0|nr:hypothetical protein [Nocardioides campestrisoli]
MATTGQGTSATDVAALDAAGVLEHVQVALLSRRAAEVDDLRLVAHWALLHGSDPRDDPTASGWDRLVELGGEGTPRVRDLCLAELAVVRRTHVLAVRSAMADVLDLRHRLPRTWAVVESLEGEAWVARRVAAMSRRLSLLDVGVVDAAVSVCLAGEAPSRVLEIAEAKVIEADPAAHAARVEQERMRRYVSLSRTDEHGLRHVVARVEAGDAVYVDAMVTRVAEILATQVPDDVPADQRPTLDQLRADALGWLARPAELLTLLLEHADDARTTEAPADEAPAQDAHTDPTRPASSRALAFPADLLAALRAVDPARLRPRATLVLHLTDQGMANPTRSVARVEECGPVLAAQAAEWLRHSHVTVRPVLDLADRVAAAGYEHPEGLKERVWLITGGRDMFPWAPGRSRRVDYDHPDPYVRGGPRGQTGTNNSQPLSRRHHRYKTHAGFAVRQVAPGSYVWRSRHGHCFAVGPHGTTPVSPEVVAPWFADCTPGAVPPRAPLAG